jgi:hypothetical protein
MILKNLLSHILSPDFAAGAVFVKHLSSKTAGVDVRSLAPTAPMSEAEKLDRIRAGRVAEMTEFQAGL